MLVGNKSDLRPEVEISQVKVCVVSVPTLHVNNMLITDFACKQHVDFFCTYTHT